MKYWQRVTKFDREAVALADRHYSRRKIGSPQFMPPGQTVVLRVPGEPTVWGWWRPHPSHSLTAMNGLNGWTCTIFRNESKILSSLLVLDAEDCFSEFGLDVGPDGLLTYVWDKRVKSRNPGFCYKLAGWSAVGRSADNKKTLLQKLPPFGAIYTMLKDLL